MKREKRLKAIKEIIKNNKISSHEELIENLKQMGYSITQSTISRDLSHLRIIKIRNYKQEEYYAMDSRYTGFKIFNIEKLKTKFKESVISTNVASNIVVIKTYPGEAQGVAAIVDGVNFEEILGTVGGDDTIICVTKSNDDSEKILKLFQSF